MRRKLESSEVLPVIYVTKELDLHIQVVFPREETARRVEATRRPGAPYCMLRERM